MAHPDPLTTCLRQDHERIRDLLDQIEDTPPDDLQALFREVRAALVQHESAEREIVHPCTRTTSQGERVVATVRREEQQVDRALARLEQWPGDEPGFRAAFRQLRALALQHFDREEAIELPRLATLPATQLEEAARRYRDYQVEPPPALHDDGERARPGRGETPECGDWDQARRTVRVALS